MNKFPNISRSITELLNFKRGFKNNNRKTLFIWVLILTSGIIIILIILFVFLSFEKFSEKESLVQERANIVSHIQFWQNITIEHPNYRDAYFELAILNFKIKNIKAAELYTEKALVLDPNFKQGMEFKKTLANY